MEIRQVRFAVTAPKPTRVCAYARVSSGKDAMLHSLDAQVDHYSHLIRHTPGWEYAGVYVDEAETGTRDTRDSFIRMMHDARKGKLDLIITKSISRFARNTLTLLEAIRELKELHVDVFFEEQNIHTLTADGELILTLLASFAQEESLSVSENMKWRIRKNFENGIPWNATVFGYRLEGERFKIMEGEAETVAFIFSEYLAGKGATRIANELNSQNIKTRFKNEWTDDSILCILKNPIYTGELLLQKTYRTDHLSKKKAMNHGELDQYLVQDAHEAIITPETFQKVQEEIRSRSQLYYHASLAEHPLSGKIICGNCNDLYKRKINRGKAIWVCNTYSHKGKTACSSKQLSEAALEDMILEFGLIEEIKEIEVGKDRELLLTFSSGRAYSCQYKAPSRKDSWTSEMKKNASKRAKEKRTCLQQEI